METIAVSEIAGTNIRLLWILFASYFTFGIVLNVVSIGMSVISEAYCLSAPTPCCAIGEGNRVVLQNRLFEPFRGPDVVLGELPANWKQREPDHVGDG